MTYTNPVYPHECADPFALAAPDGFWCYRTGFAADGRVFGVLHSADLVHWELLGGAMTPLAESYQHYWAPEVSYSNGVYYLYYAVGRDVPGGVEMHLRAATAAHPRGPFVDAGKRLTYAPFAIDAHVFVDDDGTRWLFYATDFLDVERVGTGTVMDRLLDPLTLEGRPKPVSRARFDWQIFDPSRALMGGIRWHTLEGSFVLKHKGRYYQMFSGGNYQNPSYGVGYAVTEDLSGSQEWEQPIDGAARLPVLRTIPGQVQGPGHNSVVLGPDRRQRYCVYHVIKPGGPFERVLAVDRLEWVGERLVVLGPSHTPQPTPVRGLALPPLIARWVGGWTVRAEEAGLPGVLRAEGAGKLTFNLPASDFLFHTWVRGTAEGALGEPYEGAWEAALVDGQGAALLAARFANGQLWINTPPDAKSTALAHPGGFSLSGAQPFALEVCGQTARVRLGDTGAWEGQLAGIPARLVLASEAGGLEFAAPSITPGWEEDFSAPGLEARGWQVLGGPLACDGRVTSAQAETRLVKAAGVSEYEWVVNARLVGQGAYVLYPAWREGEDHGAALRVEARDGGWWVTLDGESLSLPEGFDPGAFQQFRGRVAGGRLSVDWFEKELGSWKVEDGAAALALKVEAGEAEFDLARVTGLGEVISTSAARG